MLIFLKSLIFFFLLSSTIGFYFFVLAFKRIVSFFTGKKDLEQITHEVATSWAKTLFSLTPGWSLDLKQKENMPKEGSQYIIVANHESATDILALYFLDRRFCWLAKKEAFKVPFIGLGMKWGGHIPVERGVKESHAEALKRSKEKIRSGTPMLFFPEGTRSTLGYPKEFKVGAFKIAKEMEIPVVPVVLKGAGTLLRKGSLAFNKATMSAKVLKPLTSPEGESIEEFAKRVETLVRDEHTKI